MRMEDTSKYRKFYSDDAFWRKLGRTAGKMGIKLTYYALVLFYTMMDPATPRQAKLVIIGALGYLVLPVDLIPDFIPGGHVDDLGVVTAAIWQILKSITPQVRKKALDKLTTWFPKSDPVDLPEIDEQ